MSDKYIYINLQIPKTAGYTLRYHIDKNFKYNHKHLLLSYDLLGLSMYNPPKSTKEYKVAAWKFLGRMTKKERNRVRVIHGHTVPYGIHEFFDREPRYFTFVRDPIKRSVSLYNYRICRYNLESEKESYKEDYYKNFLLLNGKIPSFKQWLEKVYTRKITKTYSTMVDYLKIFGYLTGEVNRMNIKKALDKFYFVGLTKNYNEESMYIFEKLGMHKFFIDQNISQKAYELRNKKTEAKLILKYNKFDKYLFDEASKKNKRFKRQNGDYFSAVTKKTIEKKIFLPFTQTVFAARETAKRIWKYAFYGEPINSK